MKVRTALAVVGAVALLALGFGSATASATVLCKENKSPCPAASIYPVGTKLTASLKAGTEATLTAPFVEIKCAKSEVEPIITGAGGPGKLVQWQFNTMNFGACNTPVNVLANGIGSAIFLPGTTNATVSLL